MHFLYICASLIISDSGSRLEKNARNDLKLLWWAIQKWLQSLECRTDAIWSLRIIPSLHQTWLIKYQGSQRPTQPSTCPYCIQILSEVMSCESRFEILHIMILFASLYCFFVKGKCFFVFWANTPLHYLS